MRSQDQKRSRDPSSAPGRLLLLTQVAPEQPLHRALGLTDEELDRIRELLGREPNDFELAVFSLLWSEHCGYKHSALLLKRLPSRGGARLAGARRERGRDRPRRRRGRRVQGRVAQPSLGGRAVPGRRDRRRRDPPRHRRDGRAADRAARRPALRRARPPLRPRGRRDRRTTGTRVGVADRRRRGGLRRGVPRTTASSTRCASGLLPADRVTRATRDGDRRARRPLRRHDRPRRDRRRLRARERGARRGRRGQAPDRADRRPVHGQEADRGVARARRRRARRVAAGLRRRRARLVARRDGPRRRRHRRPPRPRPAARGRDGAVGDHDLRVARSGWSRSCGRRCSTPCSAVCATWELACTPIGEVTDTGELRAFFDGEVVGSIPATLLTDECPRYEVETRAGSPGSCGRSFGAQPFAEGMDLRAVRPARRLAHRSPSRARRRRAAAAAVAARARGLARGTAARRTRPVPGRRAGRARRRAQRRLRRRRAARAHRLPQLRQPGEAGDRLGARRRRSRASPRRPRRSASRSSRATSRSTTRPTGGRSHRRRSSAASGSFPTSARSRGAGEAATSSSSRPHPASSTWRRRRHWSASSGRLLLC